MDDLGNTSHKIESPKVTLFGPESGIITMTFESEYGEKHVFEVSDCFYDTFSQIKFWLEDLIDESNDSCSAFVDVDDEELYLLHYEKCPWLYDNPPVNTDACDKGVFMIISDYEKSTPYVIFCEKRELVRQMYEQIMFFSSGEQVNTPKYMVTWGDADDDGYSENKEGWDEYERDINEGLPRWKGHKIFQDRFRSTIIEKYLTLDLNQ